MRQRAKTYAAYCRRAAARNETIIGRDEWKHRRAVRRSRIANDAEKDLVELERLADAGDSCAMAELDEIDND